MNPDIERIKLKSELIQGQGMKEAEACTLLLNEFPTIATELKQQAGNDIYKSIRCLADLTGKLARLSDLREVKHCFDIAEKMLAEGNSIVRNAIENTYIYSLTPLLDLSPLKDKLKALLNAPLRCEYYRQVMSSGI